MKNLKDRKFFDLIKEYLCVYLPKLRQRSPHTTKSSRDSINLLISFFEEAMGITIFDLTLKELTGENVRKFTDWLVDEKQCNPSTANQRLARIKAFVSYLVNHCQPSEIPALLSVLEVMKFPEVQNSLPKGLTLDQVSLLLSMPDLTIPIEFRDCCFMSLMYDSGCRDNEIRSLRLKDVKIEKGKSKITVLGKGNRMRFVPISENEEALLQKYILLFHKEQTPDCFLFFASTKAGKQKLSNDNSLRVLRKYSERAKISSPRFPHVHPHMLRHSRGQQLYDAGMPLPLVSDFLGHSNINVTQVYARSSVEMKRNAVEKAILAHTPLVMMEKPEFMDDEKTIKLLYGL